MLNKDFSTRTQIVGREKKEGGEQKVFVRARAISPSALYNLTA